MLVRNLSLGAPAMGPRAPSRDRWWRGQRSDEDLREWLLDAQSPRHSFGFLVCIIALLFIGFGLATQFDARSRHAARGITSPVILAVFVTGYCAYLIVSEFLAAIDPIDNRLLSPIFAPCIVLATIGAERFADQAAAANWRLLRRVAVAAFSTRCSLSHL